MMKHLGALAGEVPAILRHTFCLPISPSPDAIQILGGSSNGRMRAFEA